MKNEIFIDLSTELAKQIKVMYKISENNDIQHIECIVEMSSKDHSWLQMSRFDFRSLVSEGQYRLLFNDLKFNKNLPTIQFVDKVYKAIMNKNGLIMA